MDVKSIRKYDFFSLMSCITIFKCWCCGSSPLVPLKRFLLAANSLPHLLIVDWFKHRKTSEWAFKCLNCNAT